MITFKCGCSFETDENGKPVFDPTISKLNLECPATWDLICEGNTKGVFQLDTQLGRSKAKQVAPRNIQELADLISIIRPGTMEAMLEGKSLTQHYIDRKHGREEVTYIHPALESILKDTQGILCYQESSMKIAQEIAGFNLQEADSLRKCLAAGSMVMTNEGMKLIESLVHTASQYSVLTYDIKNDTVQYAPLKSVWGSGEQRCIRITIENGTCITLTHKHKVFAHNRTDNTVCWMEAKYLTLNHDLLVPSNKLDKTRWIKISRITEAGRRQTYDFEVDHPVLHWGFINAILVSNSIGKKDTTLMKEIETQFLDRCKKHGVVDEATAKEIFSWIRASQRYAFNKCLSPDTLVQTKTETKKLSEVQIGDYVTAPNYGYVKVLDVIDNGEREVVDVLLYSDHRITCTMDHKFQCLSGIYSLREILEQDEYILTNTDTYARVRKVSNTRKIKTMDIEVDSPDHIFYGNGIATSNSHGVAYAMYSYQFAYAKAHFPRAFFTASLRAAYNKPEPFQEIQELIDNANAMGISVKPPCIAYLNKEFELINKTPVFGLVGIKNVGASMVDDIKKNVEEKGLSLRDCTWGKFLAKCGPVIKKDAMISMIKSGALDLYKVPRSRMLYEFEIYREMRKKDRDFLSTFSCNSLSDCVIQLIAYVNKTRKKGVLKQRHLEYLDQILCALQNPPYALVDRPGIMAKYERDVLGANLVFFELDEYDLTSANCSCAEYMNGFDRKNIKIGGRLDRLSEWKTKKKKELMAFVTLRDQTGVLESVMFPDVYCKYQDQLAQGNMYLFSGYRSKKGGGFIITGIKELNKIV